MKHAILFLSDKSSQWIIDNFKSVSSLEDPSYEAFFLYHERNQSIPEAVKGLNYFSFTSDILHELGYTPINEDLIPGNNHFPLLKFYLQNPEYDYYWMVEDDVCFTGNWGSLFDAYREEETDFISSHIKRFSENPGWIWWDTFHANQEEIPDSEKICSFNPVYRLSKRALRCIDQALKEGWSGHHEVLIPSLMFNRGYSITDMGGIGNFVESGNENRFYTNDTMSHLPVELGSKSNLLYHPVKEKKVIDLRILKKNCVISAVGNNSLHREWVKGNPDFDLHLIIYDNSYNKFYSDTLFIAYQKGYKFRLIYNYFQNNPEYLERYDYFFLPDDDILMDTENISKLFRMMQELNLEIAQPALSDSYYTYEHTLRDRFCKLRYTNFVEMMLPCFSRKALKKVLKTFDQEKSGWGIEYHWAQLIAFTGKEIAVIDDLYASHTRAIQSYNQQNMDELNGYVRKNNLSREITETDFVPVTEKKNGNSNNLITERATYMGLLKITDSIAGHLFQSFRNSVPCPFGFGGLNGISLLFLNYYRLSEKKIFLEGGLTLTERLIDRAKLLRKNISFKYGLSGFGWYIEYLAQHGFIENNTDEILKDLCRYFNVHQYDNMSFSGAISYMGAVQHYLIRMSNPNFDLGKELNQLEKEKFTVIIHKMYEWSATLSIAEKKFDLQNIVDCMLLLCQAKRILPLPEVDLTLSKMLGILDQSFSDNKLPYLLKSYAIILAAENLKDQSLWNKTIQAVSECKEYVEDKGLQQLLNVYLLHKIYLLTHMEIFKTRAHEILYRFIEEHNNGTSFLNKGKTSDLIYSGLILTSILLEKDPELDNCIL